MKTLELKLKKDILIVDAEGLEITQALIFNKFGNYNLSCYDFLGNGSELTEEIASEFMSDFDAFNEFTLNYEYLKNFIYIVESKGFYWLENECDNQFCENGKVDLGYNTFFNCQVCEKLEEKTFKNPLIFVKKWY